MATIRKRKNGSYEIKVSCGYGIDGRQHNQYRSYYPEEGMTPRQIEKELNRQAVLFEEECKKGQITSAVKFQVFAEQWFEEYASVNLRPTSYARMKQLTKRVYAAIGHKRIDKITARDIQKFVTDMMVNGKNINTGRPLSRKTAVHHLSFISAVFTYAVRMGMLCDNPCRRVFVPKQEQDEKEIFTLDEVKALFANLEREPLKYQVFLMLAIYSGFRRSEMLGLEWKDIDFENDLVHVRRTSQYTSERGIYTDTTKTKKSKRVSKMPPLIMELLKRFRTEQSVEAKLLGTQWIDNDRLFTKWNGEPMNPQTPFEWLKGYCERIGIPFKNIHSLRHLHASLLIFEGVDVVAVSADMGHSVVGTTIPVPNSNTKPVAVHTDTFVNRPPRKLTHTVCQIFCHMAALSSSPYDSMLSSSALPYDKILSHTAVP